MSFYSSFSLIEKAGEITVGGQSVISITFNIILRWIICKGAWGFDKRWTFILS